MSQEDINREMPAGIVHCREVLFSPDGLSRAGATWYSDLDDTLINGCEKRDFPPYGSFRVELNTIEALDRLKQAGVGLSVATNQSWQKAWPLLTAMANAARNDLSREVDLTSLFSGPLIFEGGGLVLYPGSQIPVITARPEVLTGLTRMREWIESNTIAVDDPDLEGWRILSGVDPDEGTYVMHNPGGDNGIATAILGLRGPHLSADPTYADRYEIVRQRLLREMEELGIEGISATEAGNGAIILAQEGLTKGSMLNILAEEGHIDLSRVVFSGDGLNDMHAAQIVGKSGGGVVIPANAVDELRSMAHYVASQYCGRGLAEAIHAIVPQQQIYQ